MINDCTEQKARKILRKRMNPYFEPDGKEDWELDEFGFKANERYAGEIRDDLTKAGLRAIEEKVLYNTRGEAV